MARIYPIVQVEPRFTSLKEEYSIKVTISMTSSDFTVAAFAVGSTEPTRSTNLDFVFHFCWRCLMNQKDHYDITNSF